MTAEDEDKLDFRWGLDLAAFSESDRKLILAAARAGEEQLADRGFDFDLVTHAEFEGRRNTSIVVYVSLYISPTVVRINERRQSACQFGVRDNGQTVSVTSWSDARENFLDDYTHREHERKTSRFFRRSPETDRLIQFMDEVLKNSGEIKGVGRLPGGMQQLVQKWAVYIFEGGDSRWHMYRRMARAPLCDRAAPVVARAVPQHWPHLPRPVRDLRWKMRCAQ